MNENIREVMEFLPEIVVGTLVYVRNLAFALLSIVESVFEMFLRASCISTNLHIQPRCI